MLVTRRSLRRTVNGAPSGRPTQQPIAHGMAISPSDPFDVAFPGVIGARDIAIGSRRAIVVVGSRCLRQMRVPRAEDRLVGDIGLIETMRRLPRVGVVGSDRLLPRGSLDHLEDLP
jgi:hypothetical protein